MSGAEAHKRGLTLALCSVALVAVAQLLLKFGVAHIAPPTTARAVLPWLGTLPLVRTLLPLALGAGCYGVSVLCWIGALGRLPLSLAYPLLSLSYPLVYLGATWLPGFDESLDARRIAGIGLIMLGVSLLAWKSNAHARAATARTPR